MLRRLAQVPGFYIALLWVLVLLAEAIILVAAHSTKHRSSADAFLGATPETFPANRTLSAGARDSLAAFILAATRPLDSLTEARRDTALVALGRQNQRLTARERDSLLQSLDIPSALTAAQRDSVNQNIGRLVSPLLEMMIKMFDDPALWWAAIAIAALVYGLPLLTVGFTVSWLVARKKYGASR